MSAHLTGRRGVWSALGVLATGLTDSGIALSTEGSRLHVFVPSDEKPRTIQKNLVAALPNLIVTVFGKSRDFEGGVRNQRPAAILAPAPVLDTMGFAPTLQGVRAGVTEEPYVLITVGRAVSPASLGEQTVGVFGIMGRRDMRNFCERLLGTSRQKIKTVTKYPDLLPLLQFEVAKGVILPKRFAQVVTSRSQLNLKVQELPDKKVGLIALSVRQGSDKNQIISSIRNLGSMSKNYIGVDGWR